MEATSVEALRAALLEAIVTTAKSTSVKRRDIERLVPSKEADAILAVLGPQHKQALETVHRYGSSFTSFLARSLHVEDGSAAAYLRGLASRHYDDEFICAPLTTFAEQLARWQELMERCAQDLRSNRRLTASFRFRRLARAALGVFAGFSLSVLVAAAAWWWLVAEASRKRLDAALQKPDPCADEAIAPSDRKRARPGHIEALGKRADLCREQRRRQDYVTRCATLADHVESSQMTAQDDTAAGESTLLLRRVASAALTLQDLTLSETAMPCQDTPAGVRLWGALGRAAGKAEALWGQAETVSPKVLGLVSQGPFMLSAESQAQLATHADTRSRRAVVTGQAAELKRARALCDLQVQLRAEPLGRGCKALFRLSAGR
jgi:hypothetical protein